MFLEYACTYAWLYVTSSTMYQRMWSICRWDSARPKTSQYTAQHNRTVNCRIAHGIQWNIKFAIADQIWTWSLSMNLGLVSFRHLSSDVAVMFWLVIDHPEDISYIWLLNSASWFWHQSSYKSENSDAGWRQSPLRSTKWPDQDRHHTQLSSTGNRWCASDLAPVLLASQAVSTVSKRPASAMAHQTGRGEPGHSTRTHILPECLVRISSLSMSSSIISHDQRHFTHLHDSKATSVCVCVSPPMLCMSDRAPHVLHFDMFAMNISTVICIALYVRCHKFT